MMDIHGDKFNSHLFQHKLKMLFAKNPQSFVPNPALSYQYFGKAAVSIQTEEDGRSYADNWPCCLTGWEHWEVSWTKVVNVGQDTNRFAFLSPTSGEVRHAAVKLLRAAFRDAALEGNLARPYPYHAGALPEVHTAEPRCLPEPWAPSAVSGEGRVTLRLCLALLSSCFPWLWDGAGDNQTPDLGTSV